MVIRLKVHGATIVGSLSAGRWGWLWVFDEGLFGYTTGMGCFNRGLSGTGLLLEAFR